MFIRKLFSSQSSDSKSESKGDSKSEVKQVSQLEQPMKLTQEQCDALKESIAKSLDSFKLENLKPLKTSAFSKRAVSIISAGQGQSTQDDAELLGLNFLLNRCLLGDKKVESSGEDKRFMQVELVSFSENGLFRCNFIYSEDIATYISGNAGESFDPKLQKETVLEYSPELKTLLSYIPDDKYHWEEALLKVDGISFLSAMAQLFHKKFLNNQLPDLPGVYKNLSIFRPKLEDANISLGLEAQRSTFNLFLKDNQFLDLIMIPADILHVVLEYRGLLFDEILKQFEEAMAKPQVRMGL